MTKPTVGRILHYHGPEHGYKALCALVACVLDDTHVNLTVFSQDGSYAGGHGHVALLDAAPEKPNGAYCLWPPRETGSMNPPEAIPADEMPGRIGEPRPIKKPKEKP